MVTFIFHIIGALNPDFKMYKFVLFCKSYAGDLELVKLLVKSCERFNKDRIPLYISVPETDLNLFAKNLENTGVYLITDESITTNLIFDSDEWFTPGYINQQLVKLSFWETRLAKNYFCIDSDSYFLRDFFYHDFMADDETPYSVLFEDKELCVDPIYYKGYWQSRLESLNLIKEKIGLKDTRLITCHNNTTLSSKVLESFRDEFMLIHNLEYIDILKISPFEYSWYNFWLQKSKIIPIISVEPFFKMFHLKEHYLDYRKKEITEKDIARAYIGICINSNWAKDYEINVYDPIVKSQDFKMKIVKDFIKKNIPSLVKIIREGLRLFKSIPQRIPASHELQIGEDYESFLERTVYRRNPELMKLAFNNSYIVHNGPFKGMRYIEKSSGSAFLPKILGSYEEPIQKWIKEIIDEDKHKIILDIGCAEGYYAIGFALNMPEAEIIAYDLNSSARKKVETMKKMNNVNNVIVKEECTFEELNLKSQTGTLIFCDIEGAEATLLDPEKVPNLFKADILVESHDCIVPGVTELLINRFYKTHVVETVVDYPSRVNNYELPKTLDIDDYIEVINEHRADGMRFIYMKSLL